ncbi:MAG TPA: hypothetical protein VFR38_00495 [Gaiellaceae bacterium]|nr:hypothetical protein [Gaiellaceae bacterium]
MQTARDELSPASVGAVVVSGMLAQQLAKELSAGAAPRAILVHDATNLPFAEVLVRIIAGEPSEEDEELVADADGRGTPVVVVQLWPQDDWTPPFVLSPFVVECRPGKGFPLAEIADRIFEASEHGPLLAARIPVLKETIARALVRRAVLRSAFLGVASSGKDPTRPMLALEQVRMLARLRSTTTGPAESDGLPAIAAGAGVALASGFVFRGAARAARKVLPAPVADAAVAAVGTWVLARALRVLEERLPSS